MEFKFRYHFLGIAGSVLGRLGASGASYLGPSLRHLAHRWAPARHHKSPAWPRWRRGVVFWELKVVESGLQVGLKYELALYQMLKSMNPAIEIALIQGRWHEVSALSLIHI